MGKNQFHRLAAWVILAAMPGWAFTAPNPPASFTGNLVNDAGEKEFFFTLGSAGPLTLRTFSYAGGTNGAGIAIPPGGFDPTLSLFDSGGTLIAVNQDAGCTLVSADPVTRSCWDAYLSLSLPAGSYRAVLTESVNLPAGPTLANSFLYNPSNLFFNADVLAGVAAPPLGGQSSFTAPPGATGSFWDFFPSQRTSFYALDIAGATTAFAPVVSSSAALPFGISGASYGPLTLTVQSGPGVTYTWTPPVSGLPPGISMSSAGVLSGTPVAPGTYTFTAVATDSVQPLQQTETITVYSPVSISSGSLPGGIVGQLYGAVQLIGTGGSGIYSWSAAGLANGLAISPSGVLSGTTPASVPQFMVTLTDGITGSSSTATFSISVSVPPLSVSGASLTELAVGSAASGTFGASGGTPPYTFASSNLPPGLTLGSANGALGGAPTSPGNFMFTVNISDSAGQSGKVPASISILGLTSSALPAGATAANYSFTFTALGGSGTYRFSATGLPSGLSLSSNGVLTGTPTAPGSSVFTVQVGDGVVTASSQITLVVKSGTVTLSLSGSLANGQANVPYNAGVNAGGGSGSYSYKLFAGVLPPGLSLSGNGQIAGTPAAPGTYTFTVLATDTTGATASGLFSIAVAPAPLTLSAVSLPNGLTGSDYPVQIISGAGGLQPYIYTLTSGSLPPGLSFSNGQIGGIPAAAGTYTFTVTVTDNAKSAATLSLSIAIGPAQADLILSDTLLTFNVMSGANALPASDNVTVRSSVVQQILNYSYSVSPVAPWLSVNGGSSTPGSLSVGLTNAALTLNASGTPYTTALQIACTAPSPCAGHTQSVSIALTVTAPPPQLTVTNSLLAFTSTASNPAPVSQPLGIQNSGGGALAVTSIMPADAWVTVSNAPSSVASGPAVSATVAVNPAGLPVGYNSSSVTVNSAAGSITIPVTLYISPNTIESLSPAIHQFSTAAGGSPSPDSASFQVSVNSAQPVSWNTSVLPGAAWLTASTSSGSSTLSSAGTVNFGLIDSVVSQLPAGTYYGTIQVTSLSAANSPQNYQVSLTVAPPATLPVPNPEPAGLLFLTGSANSRSVGVYVNSGSSAQPVAFQASASTTDGANWLSVTPATGSTSASGPGTSTVTVSPAGLAPGVYTGLVSYAFSAAAVRSVNVTYVVTGAASSVVTGSVPHAAGGCTPQQLVATQTGLLDNFSQLATLPTALQVLVTDNCGNPAPNAQVGVTFSNGDATLLLTPVDSVSGIYTGTWVPLGISSQVAVTAVASMSGLASGLSRIGGLVTQFGGPVLTQNAVLSVYNPLIGGAISPGAILQIYGSNLAQSAAISSMLPLTTTLANTSVFIGGTAVPLYYVSPTQINAQAPFELVPGNQYQVVVSVGGALSAPATVSVAPVEPGIAAFQSGQIVAQHLDGTLVTETSPAQPGTYVVFYLAGLGATDTPIPDGAPSPFSPLAHPVTQPVLTLNGASQPYQFVGLTPGIVGLYQINFLVPALTPDGDMVLSVSQSGVPGNAVILPVHR